MENLYKLVSILAKGARKDPRTGMRKGALFKDHNTNIVYRIIELDDISDRIHDVLNHSFSYPEEARFYARDLRTDKITILSLSQLKELEPLIKQK